MNKNNFRFFGMFIFVTIVLSLYFVWAAALAPTALTFNNNVTANYDDDGNFSLNWTAGAGANSTNYSIFIWAGSNLLPGVSNDSETGYTFGNWTEANYTFHVSATDGTGYGPNSTNISMVVDRTDPVVDYATGALADNAVSNTLTSIFVNISVTEANNHSLVFSLYNSTSLVSQVVYLTNATLGINFTGLPVNVAYRYNVTVNDSAARSNTTATRTFTLDNVAPVVSLTKKTSGQTSLELSISGVEGTCTVDRSGATISGSTLTEIGLSCGGSYSYIVTCTDAAGNAGPSSATSFSTTGCSSGGGSSTPKPKKASYSFSKITPGSAAILKNFDAEMGVKEIKIEVNNPAQSVSITITKSDGKPAVVSVEKSGKVYKYLQIESTNLGDNFGKATITLQVGKSWLSSNGLDTAEVALFKFDENSEKWNELTTTYTGSEGDNELYEVELTSFSFFAVGEKSAVGVNGEEVAEDKDKAAEEKSNLIWLWVVIILVVFVVYVAMNRKKYSNLFFNKQ